MRQSLELSILLIYEVDGDGRLHVMWVYILFVSFVVIFFLPHLNFAQTETVEEIKTSPISINWLG